MNACMSFAGGSHLSFPTQVLKDIGLNIVSICLLLVVGVFAGALISIYPSICLSVYLSIYTYVCVSLSLSLHNIYIYIYV